MSKKYTPKPDHGTLFPNGYKKSEAHPDYTGTYVTQDGTTREVAAWINEGNQGKPFLSLKFQDQYDATK